MTHRSLPLALLVAVAAFGCCSAKTGPQPKAPNLPPPTLFLTSVFTDNPQSYLGKFIDDSAKLGTFDETDGRPNECLAAFDVEVVRAAGGRDEYLGASTSIAGSLGLASVGEASGGWSTSNTVRVQYRMTEVMRIAPKDPAAYRACCDRTGACTGRIIGEFIRGTGKVMIGAKRDAGGKAGGSYGTGTAKVDVKDGVEWTQVQDFDNAYFGFRIQKVGEQDETPIPDDWATRLPTARDRQYWVGMSSKAASRALARERALRDAQSYVVKYLGTEIATRSSTLSSAMEPYLEDASFVESIAGGLTRYVRDVRWLDEVKEGGPSGTEYYATVLVHVLKSDLAVAKADMARALTEKLAASGKLDAAAQAELDKAAGTR
jgi:hypothetical protein